MRSPQRGTNNRVWLVDLADRRVVVRGYENLTGAQVTAEHRLLAGLRGGDLPYAVPCPIVARDGRTWAATPSGPVAVFDWLPGAPGRPTPELIYRVGHALGDLDAALARLDVDRAPHDWRRPLAATHPAVTDLADLTDEFGEHYGGGLADLDAEYADLLRHAPIQLIHQDMALSNVLTEGDEVTALLDFEVAGQDLRVADVVAALMQTGCTQETPGDQLDRAAQLLRGYGQAVQLTEPEITALPTLLRFRAAGSAVWRYGRYRQGRDDRRSVLDRLAALRATDAWVAANGSALVDLAGHHCGP